MTTKDQISHTPGPWKAEWSTANGAGTEMGWHVFSNDTVDAVGVVCEIPDSSGREAVNARLIANTPHLLAGCIFARDWLRDRTKLMAASDDKREMVRMARKLDQVIVEAIGEPR